MASEGSEANDVVLTTEEDSVGGEGVLSLSHGLASCILLL